MTEFNFIQRIFNHVLLFEQHIRALKNFESEPPYQKAYYYLAVLLTEHVWTKDELLAAHKCKLFQYRHTIIFIHVELNSYHHIYTIIQM